MGTLLHGLWEIRLVQPPWKTIWSFLKKLEMELHYDPAIPLLGIYSKKPKAPIWKDIGAYISIALLSTIGKVGK